MNCSRCVRAAMLSTIAFSVHVSATCAEPLGDPVDFSREVLPLLSDRCFTCHGPDSNTREAGLRLDDVAIATSPLDSGVTAIVPGDLEASELIRRITSSDESERMPPVSSGKSLSPDEIALLRRWVDSGAIYKKHWAFETVIRPPVPSVRDGEWPANPIDNFVLARMEAEGLSPSPPASREKLVRRIHFDLIGLPPSPSEINQFTADIDAGAVDRLVDRLYESPHYGERMAIDWLDGARYADSNGYQNDFARQMWPWRDWVIAAFNANMPFDQFAREQLAGDLLDNPSRSQIVATGFNRNNRTVTEAGSLPEEWLVENVVDRVETTSTVFLGLTLGCCRCHDHKYDPISQKEFYEFFAFFNNIDEQGVNTEKRGNVEPLIRVPSAKDDRHLAKLQRKIDDLSTELSLQLQRVAGKHLNRMQSNDSPSRFSPLVTIASAMDSRNEVRPVGGGFPTCVVAKQFDFGSILTFEGRGGADFQLEEGPTRNSSFTVTLWARPQDGRGSVISKMDDRKNFRGSDILLLDDLRVAVHLISRWPTDALKIVTRDPLPRAKWSHLAVTYDGSARAAGIKIYVNGVVQETETEADCLKGSIATDQPLRLGQRSTSDFYEGELSDIRIYGEQFAVDDVQKVLGQRIEKIIQSDRVEGLADWSAALIDWLAQFEGFNDGDDLIAQQERLLKAEKELAEFEETLPTVMVMRERSDLRPTYLLKRGQYQSPDKSETLQPDVPDCLPPLPKGPRDRRALAEWITAPENPLTARVTVNRLWAKFFGRGIVKSVDNFGLQGELPSHPELLDWLAAELLDSGWDLQHVQRLIVNSRTYQQSSHVTRKLQQRDPENILLARGPRHRLPAELLRDNALFVSGLLNPQIGGRSIMPYQPKGLWAELAGGAHENYVQDKGAALYRRSLYVYRKRTVPHPVMNTFDAPSWEICQVTRSTTNTPLQALALLNDVTYIEASRKLAERIIRERSSPSPRLKLAFRLATSRWPTRDEESRLLESWTRYREYFRAHRSEAEKLIAHGESSVSADVEPSELAAYTMAASLILNLDETITKE